MGKLYFKYGAMGSSKTAQALMCKFNYEQKGYKVFLFKSDKDKRMLNSQGKAIVGSRIGLKSDCLEFDSDFDFLEYFKKNNLIQDKNVVIIDECQFLSAKQVNQLKILSFDIPVLCYGLMTNYKTLLFEGSKRLVEIADSISEIKSVCRCGRKATVNARIYKGNIVTEGEELQIGGDESYESMCYRCYLSKINKIK